MRLPDNQPEKYGIYYTLVNRIDYLERLAYHSNACHSVEMLQTILEVQDRYQLLSAHMELKGEYENDQVLPSLALYAPHADKVFSEDELPNLFVQIFYCKFWGDKLDCPWDDEITRKIIDIFSKAMPSPCKARSVTTILPDSWKKGKKSTKKQPDDEEEEEATDDVLIEEALASLEGSGNPTIFNIMVRVIMGSLLGIYDHCKIKANFCVRRKIYKWFCMLLPKQNLIDRWIRDNKHLIIYIMREFIFYAVDAIPSLNDYMEQNYYWFHMRKNTFDAMDTVRDYANRLILTYLDSHPMVDTRGVSVWEKFLHDGDLFSVRAYPDVPIWKPGDSWFCHLGSTLAQYNKTNLDFCHRPIEMSFLDSVIVTCKEIEDVHFKDERYAADIPKEVEAMIYKIVLEGLRLETPMGFDWMQMPPFLVSLKSITRLNHAQKLYLRETSRSRIQSVLKKMAKKYPYDFHIVKHYFYAYKKKMSVIFYSLPDFITRAQIQRFHELYQTLPGEELDENAGMYYVCPNCGELKARVVPSDAVGKTAKERECTLSFDKISIDMTSDKLYCSRPAAKINTKKRSVAVDIVGELLGTGTDQRKENKKKSKDQRKKKIVEACPHTNLTRFNFIGQILRTERYGEVFVCPFCLCLTTYGRSAYKNGGSALPSCGCNRKDPNAGRPAPRCTLCDPSEENAPEHVVYHLVYDDVEDKSNPRLKMAPFCTTKHPLHWLDKWNQVLRLSHIKKAIDNHWTSVEITPQGDRVFVQNNNR